MKTGILESEKIDAVVGPEVRRLKAFSDIGVELRVEVELPSLNMIGMLFDFNKAKPVRPIVDNQAVKVGDKKAVKAVWQLAPRPLAPVARPPASEFSSLLNLTFCFVC